MNNKWRGATPSMEKNNSKHKKECEESNNKHEEG
jgi:hypothetical protein